MYTQHMYRTGPYQFNKFFGGESKGETNISRIEVPITAFT